MRGLWILAAALMLLAEQATAQKVISPTPNPPVPVPSQPPPPGAREPASPPQPQSTNSQNQAERDQRGTAQVPLVVEVLNAPKTDAEAAEAAAEKERKASSDWWTIFLAGALVFATGLQFIALFYQGWQLRRGVSVAGQAANEARDAIKATEASAEAANTHARAAEEANQINRDLLIATQRPWISARLVVAGDLVYRSDGAALLPITCALKNIGRTPATFVWPHIRGILQGPTGKNNVALQRLFMAEIRGRDDISRQFGHIIFPNQEIPVEAGIILLNDEIKASHSEGTEREILQIAVIGFVEYQFTFTDQPRETGFIYMILAEHPDLRTMTFTIFRDLGDIPRDKLDIRASWVDGAGFFAT